MKISRTQLKQIIKEEYQVCLKEDDWGERPGVSDFLPSGGDMHTPLDPYVTKTYEWIIDALGKLMAGGEPSEEEKAQFVKNAADRLNEGVFGGVASTQRPERRGSRRSDASAMDVPGGHGDAGSELTAAAADLVAVLRDYNINAKAEEIAYALMQQYDLG